MELWGLKTCDTCRKALKSLPCVTFRDVRAEVVPADLLEKAYARFGGALVNTKSTTWRGLSPEERETPAIALLQAHPALMKRPLIVDGDGAMHLGWGPDTRAALGVG